MNKNGDHIDSYFRSKRVNVSTLKRLDNPKWIKWKLDNPKAEDEEKRHFRIGGAIDTLLTSPERFNDEYVVLYQNRPTGKMGIFIDNLPLDLVEDSPLEAFQGAYDAAEYRVKLPVIVQSLWQNERYRDYYLSRKQALTRQILTLDELDEVEHVKSYLLNNPFTRKYFLNTDPQVEICFQVAVYFELEGLDCKALLDGVLVNHREKFLQPFDLKTIGTDIRKFPNAYLNYGYYLQATMYDKALQSLDSPEDYSIAGLPARSLEYEIRPMKFVVSEKKKYHSNPARSFDCTSEDIEAGWLGGDYKETYYVGLQKLLADFKWHKTKDYWEIPRDLYENEGGVILDMLNPRDDSK